MKKENRIKGAKKENEEMKKAKAGNFEKERREEVVQHEPKSLSG